jgi:ABC-type sugar transport system ATPase subunit
MSALDASATPVLDAHGLTKQYGDATVLRDVDLRIQPGEVRALLGENGAGKSTLIKILAGVVKADGGSFAVNGQLVIASDARSSQAAGIATLHQELQIVPGLSVAENVLLGHRTHSRLGKVTWRSMEQRAAELLGRVGQSVDPKQEASSLSPVQQTMVAIARALSRDARLVILDEPTASLTDTEAEQLFEAVKRLRTDGVGVLYVSHRLAEVKALCDTFTVLRNGEKVSEGMMEAVSISELIASMAGRPFDALFPTRATHIGEALLEARSLTGRRIRDVNLVLHEREILGIAGLAGSGRSELLRMLAGIQPHRSGAITLHRDPVPRSVSARLSSGIAMVPQERKAEGVLPDTIERNINASVLSLFASIGIVRQRSAADHALRRADELHVRRRSMSQDTLTLSGGNQQKVVLARMLATDPKVMLLDEPTRGVDVGTKSEIYSLIRAKTNDGSAAIVVSSELPELLGWCDRIAVVHEGRLVGVADAAATHERELLAWCYGHTTVSDRATA